MPDILDSTTSSSALQRSVIDYGLTAADLEPRQAVAAPETLANLGLPWPAGLAPQPQPLATDPGSDDKLPEADYLVITWTIAELEALADTLTPGVNRNSWYRYTRNFATYKPHIRSGAPSLIANRLGSYFPTKIGANSVLCFKSELHLNQDGIQTGPGTATLPVADLFRQVIAEVQPKMVITAGTAGAVFPDHALGDVMITRSAKFRLNDEFKNEAFNGKQYLCDFPIPTAHLADADTLLAVNKQQLTEPDFGPPTTKYLFPGPLIPPGPRDSPKLRIDEQDFPKFHPILTTDYFEFGTSTNGLETQGCGVEMGDAVLGMVSEEMGASAPLWLVVRNASDPQINGALPLVPRALNMQAHWAVWYYQTYGYWTSVSSSIAVWAMIAGHGG
jgi:hypothetical protein